MSSNQPSGPAPAPYRIGDEIIDLTGAHAQVGKVIDCRLSVSPGALPWFVRYRYSTGVFRNRYVDDRGRSEDGRVRPPASRVIVEHTTQPAPWRYDTRVAR